MAKTKADIQREYAKRSGYAANIKYNKEHTRSVTIRFMINTESDLLNHINTQPNKSGYIKSLIKKDMEEQNQL